VLIQTQADDSSDLPSAFLVPAAGLCGVCHWFKAIVVSPWSRLPARGWV